MRATRAATTAPRTLRKRRRLRAGSAGPTLSNLSRRPCGPRVTATSSPRTVLQRRTPPVTRRPVWARPCHCRMAIPDRGPERPVRRKGVEAPGTLSLDGPGPRPSGWWRCDALTAGPPSADATRAQGPARGLGSTVFGGDRTPWRSGLGWHVGGGCLPPSGRLGPGYHSPPLPDPGEKRDVAGVKGQGPLHPGYRRS